MTCHVILCLLKKIANPFQKEYLNLKSNFIFLFWVKLFDSFNENKEI